MTQTNHGVSGGAEVEIPIRSRTTAGADGINLELSAACLAGKGSVPLLECAHCERFVAVRIEAEGPEMFVRCRAEERSPSSTDGPSSSRAGNLTPISAIMTTQVVCATADLPVSTLDRLLFERGISGAPVVDDAGRPIGVISDSDLLRLHRERGDGRGTLADGDLRVGDVMMPMAFCLPQNESIQKVAALMAFEGIHRVPIVDAAGKVTGIVSSLDVLTWVARQNGYVLGTRR